MDEVAVDHVSCSHCERIATIVTYKRYIKGISKVYCK